MQVEFTLQGKTPLLMHNPQMVDPQFEINRQLKPLTSKRNKTDDDLNEIARLEWYGGIYTMQNHNGETVVCQPSSKVRKCLIMTARIFKMGRQIERAIYMADLNVPLQHDGPKSIDELFKMPEYHSRLSVGVGAKRVMRTRPQFIHWALGLQGTFVEDAGMNFEDLERIVELAGKVEGIGDNRVNGYGRFIGKVKAIS